MKKRLDKLSNKMYIYSMLKNSNKGAYSMTNLVITPEQIFKAEASQLDAKGLEAKIYEMAENGSDMEHIRFYIDELDEKISDKDLELVLNNAEIVECEKCTCQDLASTMTTRGNEDYSIRLCEHCGS